MQTITCTKSCLKASQQVQSDWGLGRSEGQEVLLQHIQLEGGGRYSFPEGEGLKVMEAKRLGDPPHIAEGPEKGGGAFSAAGSSRLDPCPLHPWPSALLFSAVLSPSQ